MNILIAVPALDYIHARFVQCLLALDNHLREEQIDHEVLIIPGTLVYMAREKIVARAINDKFTHVLWIDADMIFEPEMFDDLWDVGKDIVTGRFVARRPPFVACQFSDIDNIIRVEHFPLEPFKIDGTGLAFTLTSSEILRKVFKQFGTCFTPMIGTGEDIAFCKRVKEVGGEMWCEPTVQVGHIAHIPVYPGDEESYLRRPTC